MLFFLSSSQREELSVCVQDLVRLSERLQLPWAGGFAGQRVVQVAVLSATASGSGRPTHRKKHGRDPGSYTCAEL